MYLKMRDCDEPLLGEGPDPESKWGMIFDGAVNVYGSGIGAIIITPRGTHIPFSAKLTFDCTNNIAEYEACIMGIEEAIDLRIKNLDIYGDSALVINQRRMGDPPPQLDTLQRLRKTLTDFLQQGRATLHTS